MPDDIIQQSLMEQLAAANLNDAQLEKAKITLDQLAAIMSEHREAVKHIRADGRLTQVGQASDLGVLATATDGRLAQVGDERLKSLDARISELTYLIRPQAPATDPVLEEMRQQETRRELKGMDELTLMELYQSAAIDGSNDMLMRSVESAVLPLIHDKTILEAGRRARGMRQSPESSKTLAQLQSVRAIIAGELAASRSQLGLPDLTLQNMAEKGAA